VKVPLVSVVKRTSRRRPRQCDERLDAALALLDFPRVALDQVNYWRVVDAVSKNT
jgi:hypothetical protein